VRNYLEVSTNEHPENVRPRRVSSGWPTLYRKEAFWSQNLSWSKG